MKNYLEFWQKMFVFNATATRAQYWVAIIVNYFVVLLYGLLTHQSQYLDANNIYQITFSTNSLIFSLLMALVWLANFTITARRLHDTNRSNWWILLSIIPIIGQVWLFILLVLPSKTNSRWSANQSEIR